ncbi:hypothetical protein PR048_020329 [Dryococelus australis]|uniref:Pre-C2HC domain-containing protein n=1 Tax=Dryococelus australis TaxID=614101 RepID=A0ABQ9H604_9NEOP|nr:hypothetical protein PR048_020329 [Dryococelus australis]
MDDTSGGRTDKPIRPAKETKINDFIKSNPKKVSKLINQPRDDFQLYMTNRYDSLSDTDSDKNANQPEPKRKRNKSVTTKLKNNEKVHSKTSQDKLVTETSKPDNDTTATRIPKYMVPIIIDKTFDYNTLITFTKCRNWTAIQDHFHPSGNQRKPHAAILKGLAASIDIDVDIDIIKQELTERHIHLQYIEQFTSKTGQGPERTIRKQGIFKVITTDYETELLYQIDVINRTTVYWEEYQPRNYDIPQCANCQMGETKNNCAWPVRCIKCKREKPEQHHHTKSCLKSATIPTHCFNCNYRQCPTFIAAKNARPKNRNTTENQPQPM